jgi:putative endonuclease
VSLSRQGIGRDGEALAARYLESKGYHILARRYRTRAGEIDLVARCGRLIVFAEVKTRRTLSFGAPFEAVHRQKQSRIARAAAHYLAHHATRDAPDCRFDVIGVTETPGRPPVVDHIEDAFRL